MKRVLVFLVLSLSLLFASDNAWAQTYSWPQWQGPFRNGLTNEKGLLKVWPEGGPEQKWIFDKCGAGYAGPAIVDGRLYILGAGRFARCLDAATGEDIWKTHLPGEFRDEYMQSSILVASGVAIVMAGHLFGLDAATGDVRWEGDPQQTRGSHSSPVLWESAGRSRLIVNLAGGWTG